jgi:type I site-specific restriction endonuclease
MNEAETRAELIDPKLKDVGWGVVESKLKVPGTVLEEFISVRYF